MNRSQYIKKLKQMRSQIHHILLLESEETVNDVMLNKVFSKSNSGSKSFDEKTQEIKKIIGKEKFDEAVNAGIKEFKKKIATFNSMSTDITEVEDQEPLERVLEKGSDIIYQTIGLATNAIYHVLSGYNLEKERPEEFTLRHKFLLSCCPYVLNTSFVQIANQFYISRSSNFIDTSRRVQKANTLIACICAPLTEEYCKNAALRISRKSGYQYTLTFAGVEALDYIMSYYHYYGSKIFLFRLIAFLFHMSTTMVQDNIMKNSKFRSFAYIVGCMLHALYNARAVGVI